MIKKNGYVIVENADEPHYTVKNFTLSALGWHCKCEDMTGQMLVSADITYVMQKVKDREYPLTRTNLEFCLNKLEVQEKILETNERQNKTRSWTDRILSLIDDILTVTLKKDKLNAVYRGKDFVVIRLQSKKAAKRMLKNVNFKGTGTHTDRKGDLIMIREISG